MKISQIIKENDDYAPQHLLPNDYNKEAEEVAEYIKQHCQPWLQATQNTKAGLVYRGTKTTGAGASPAFVMNVRQDRRPKDTIRDRHKMFNILIKYAGGVANRSNAAFVTPSIKQASEHGDPYVVFPIGKFNYTWSPKYADWTESFDDPDLFRYLSDDDLLKLMKNNYEYITQLLGADLTEMVDETIRTGEITQQFLKYSGLVFMKAGPVFGKMRELLAAGNINEERLQSHIVADRNLKEALQTTSEIMIHCDKILLVTPELAKSVVSYL